MLDQVARHEIAGPQNGGPGIAQRENDKTGYGCRVSCLSYSRTDIHRVFIIQTLQ